MTIETTYTGIYCCGGIYTCTIKIWMRYMSNHIGNLKLATLLDIWGETQIFMIMASCMANYCLINSEPACLQFNVKVDDLSSIDVIFCMQPSPQIWHDTVFVSFLVVEKHKLASSCPPPQAPVPLGGKQAHAFLTTCDQQQHRWSRCFHVSWFW